MIGQIAADRYEGYLKLQREQDETDRLRTERAQDRRHLVDGKAFSWHGPRVGEALLFERVGRRVAHAGTGREDG